MAHALRSPSARRIATLLCLAFLWGCDDGGGGEDGGGVSPEFTLHYHRALEDYAGWTVTVQDGAVESTAAAATTDGFGAVYALTVEDGAAALVFTLTKDGQTDPAGTLTVDVSGDVREAYVFSGHGQAIPRALPAIPGEDQVAVYYARPDGEYTGWGLHTWGDVAQETLWVAPLMPAGIDPDLGAGYLIDVTPDAERVNVIAHKGDTKDPGPDMGWNRSELGDIVFLTSGSTVLTTVPPVAGGVAITGAGAHLLSRTTVAWNVTDPGITAVELRWSAAAEVAAADGDVTGGTVIPLTKRAAGLSTAEKALAPHLGTWVAFDVGADEAAVRAALKGQLVAVGRGADGKAKVATQVQTAFALDDLYAYEGALGVTFAGQAPTFRLWAPTAQAVRLRVADAAGVEVAGSPFAMTEGAEGVWSYAGPADWYGLTYRYELDVYHPTTSRVEQVSATDPYAVNLATNGTAAQIVDLADPALKPDGWDALVKPPLAAPEDIVLYETHVRDFSATDETCPADDRGKYLAFTADPATSEGVAHLARLAQAGLTHVHLLPVFDFATVNEDPAERVDLHQPFADLCAKNPAVPVALCGQFAGQTIAEAMASLEGDSEQQQEIATYMKGLDAFNWGYDPFHYGAPEGSYASTAEGTAKIVEFRRMVQGLADVGLRVVMDVVYNHTNASGLADRSVLDRIVPGYYHRLNPETGFVESSSCCANTATEHRMMERLMVDTAVRWAREYKVDGFRFDLMGLHLVSNVTAVRDALAALTPAADGVDGASLYVYGEGWDMGEMAGGARGKNASQVNLAGTGIGSFNDRIRDAVRGGGPFDQATTMRQQQGFATGLFTDPNELNSGADTEKAKLASALDRIKIGMAGNLAAFRIVTGSGAVSSGANVPYNGAPTGYTQDPQEVVNYVSAHDNQTLFDILQAKLPHGESMADRVRLQNLALDVVALGQGVPFFHLGSDLLRSKSMERDSYDSGDWFNRVDWSLEESAWRSGLPNEEKDAANWPLVRELFADASIAPAPAHLAAAAAHFEEVLRVRKSSPLFRLRTKADVMARVDFLNGGPDQLPALLVMTISDEACAGAELDPSADGVVVIVNANDEAQTITVPGAAGAALHPVLAGSSDAVVKTAAVAGEAFTVPARTTAVWTVPQGSAGTLACNTR